MNTNKESEAINTCYFIHGHYALNIILHVHDVKKERRQVSKNSSNKKKVHRGCMV